MHGPVVWPFTCHLLSGAGNFDLGAAPTTKEAQAISDELYADFVSEDVDKVEMIYTKFVSLIASDPIVQTLLPLTPQVCPCPIPPELYHVHGSIVGISHGYQVASVVPDMTGLCSTCRLLCRRADAPHVLSEEIFAGTCTIQVLLSDDTCSMQVELGPAERCCMRRARSVTSRGAALTRRRTRCSS